MEQWSRGVDGAEGIPLPRRQTRGERSLAWEVQFSPSSEPPGRAPREGESLRGSGNGWGGRQQPAPWLPSTGTGCCMGQARLAWRSARRSRPLEVRSDRTLCQRLVEDTESVGEEGGGKLSSSSTATPTLLRRVNMHEAATHLLVRGLYFSMELRLELPSFPPTA